MSQAPDNKPSALMIEQVGNGYVVTDARRFYRDELRDPDATHVFQSFAELSAHLSKRFTHRAEVLHGDRAA